MLIRGLDLDDGAPGANLSLYIKPQMRPRWPPARTVHAATEWHALPLSTAGLLPYGRMGQWDEVAHFQNGNSTLGEKTWPYRPPSFPPRLNRAPRPLPALACLCVLAVSAIPVLHCGCTHWARSSVDRGAPASEGAAGGGSALRWAKASGIRHDARARLPPLQSGGLPPGALWASVAV